MGFGIITQHLSFYKKHKFIQFENNQTKTCFNQLTKSLSLYGKSGLLNSNTPLFTGEVKGWLTDIAKMSIFLSCEKKLRLGGYFVLPYKGLPEETSTLTLNRLSPYGGLALGALIPLTEARETPEPMSIEESRLDFAPFSHEDLFFIDPEKPFVTPQTPMLVLLFLNEHVIYKQPKMNPAPLTLSKEKIDYGDRLASTTHPLIRI